MVEVEVGMRPILNGFMIDVENDGVTLATLLGPSTLRPCPLGDFLLEDQLLLCLEVLAEVDLDNRGTILRG